MFKPSKAAVAYILSNLSKTNEELAVDLDMKLTKDLKAYIDTCRGQEKMDYVVNPRDAKAVSHEPLTPEVEAKLNEQPRKFINDCIVTYDPTKR